MDNVDYDTIIDIVGKGQGFKHYYALKPLVADMPVYHYVDYLDNVQDEKEKAVDCLYKGMESGCYRCITELASHMVVPRSYLGIDQDLDKAESLLKTVLADHPHYKPAIRCYMRLITCVKRDYKATYEFAKSIADIVPNDLLLYAILADVSDDEIAELRTDIKNRYETFSKSIKNRDDAYNKGFVSYRQDGRLEMEVIRKLAPQYFSNN